MSDRNTISGLTPIQPIGPRTEEEAELQRQAREFQAELRREFLEDARKKKKDDTVVGFEEKIIITGLRAREAMHHLEEMARLSPTFRRVLDKALRDNDTVWITIGRGKGPSYSTIHARDEKVYINLQQGELFDLLLHECGHALAKLDDGPLGGFGPNQRFQAIVKREMELGGGEKPYGAEVRAETKPVRHR